MAKKYEIETDIKKIIPGQDVNCSLVVEEFENTSKKILKDTNTQINIGGGEKIIKINVSLSDFENEKNKVDEEGNILINNDIKIENIKIKKVM